jgi:L-ascorbate metabolism protein UlaG (beta-lactamase superfamily)
VLPRDTLLIVHPSVAGSLREQGFTNLRELDWEQSTTLSRGEARLTVTALEAHHSHDPVTDAQVGKVNGYILRFEGPDGRYTIYWTGDCVTFEGQNELVRRFAPIDLLLPHMGGVGGDGPGGLRTMNADEAVALIRGVAPRQVIPIHHTTFSHYREPVSALVQRMEVERPGAVLTVVPEGGTAAFLR